VNAEQCQTAADHWTNPIDLSHWQLWNYIHHCHLLLLLLTPRADTHVYRITLLWWLF